jgi:hypothetical protein
MLQPSADYPFTNVQTRLSLRTGQYQTSTTLQHLISITLFEEAAIILVLSHTLTSKPIVKDKYGRVTSSG